MKNFKLLSPLLLFSIFYFLFSFPSSVWAQATMFITPSGGNYKVKELFSVLININTGGKSINAAAAQINFDNQKLEVVDLGYSRSIFTLWTDEPTFSNEAGTIRFSGGVPNPGFNGASGAILRVTFRTKAAGQAPVVFSSGSVLANDGEGTNILDSFQGALYLIQPAGVQTKPAPPPKEIKEIPVSPEMSAPIITEWPRQVDEGSSVIIRGLAFPNEKVLVFIQKGSAEPIVEEVIAGADGRFVLALSRPLFSGLYRVWAKTITVKGEISASSETVLLEVRKPIFIRIGATAFNYLSVIVTLLALLILAVLILGWFWYKVRKWQESQGKEISEAEKSLHHGFDKLKEGLAAYVEYLTNVRSVREGKKRGEMTRRELKEELENIEESIEKEIGDIKKRR